MTHLSLQLLGLTWDWFAQQVLSNFFFNMELCIGMYFGTAGVRGHRRQPSGGRFAGERMRLPRSQRGLFPPPLTGRTPNASAVSCENRRAGALGARKSAEN